MSTQIGCDRCVFLPRFPPSPIPKRRQRRRACSEGNLRSICRLYTSFYYRDSLNCGLIQYWDAHGTADTPDTLCTRRTLSTPPSTRGFILPNFPNVIYGTEDTEGMGPQKATSFAIVSFWGVENLLSSINIVL